MTLWWKLFMLAIFQSLIGIIVYVLLVFIIVEQGHVTARWWGPKWVLVNSTIIICLNYLLVTLFVDIYLIAQIMSNSLTFILQLSIMTIVYVLLWKIQLALMYGRLISTPCFLNIMISINNISYMLSYTSFSLLMALLFTIYIIILAFSFRNSVLNFFVL